MTLDETVIVILSFLVVAICTYAIVLHKKIRQLDVELFQSELDKGELMVQLYKEFQKSSPDNPNESFVKFLTDSRNSAFEYIENAQQTILEFMVVADKMPKAKSVPKDVADAYKEAYSKLIDLLPVPTTGND